MDNRITILIISFLLLFNSEGYSQYDNIWTFGINAGIDFNTAPPTAITTAIKTEEGCATICDNNGQLLFYADGDQVWDRNHQLMPNGKALSGSNMNICKSTSQGALIVPMPGNTDKYYVFSLGSWEGRAFFGRLYYSIVDMSRNNGIGDVDVNFKGILLDTLLMEQMVAVSGTECNIWLIVPSRDTVFKAYNINIGGINPVPVLSSRLIPTKENLSDHSDYTGCINVSPDGTKLILAKGSDLVLYNFDPELGNVRNPIILKKEIREFMDYRFYHYYGAAFSEDNTKLYVNNVLSEPALAQYDLLAGDSLAIVNSEVAIVARNELWGGSHGQLRRGPDGKIYITKIADPFLSVINKPNLKGIACGFEKDVVPLKAGTEARHGLPNYTSIITTRKITKSVKDTIFCATSALVQATRTSGMNYRWDDGSTGPIREVKNAGVYWVSYEINSACISDQCVDTFNVVFDFSTRKKYTSSSHSGLCKSDTILMKPRHLNGSNYVWDNGNWDRERKINKKGIYWVRYQIDSLCESHIDSFVVSYPEREYKVSFNSDSIICLTDTIQFHNTSDPHFNKLKWLFGTQDTSTLEHPEYTYSQPGSYSVMLTGTIHDICNDTAYKTIIVDPEIEAHYIVDKDSICVGEHTAFAHEMGGTTVQNLFWETGDNYYFSSFDRSVRHAYDRPGLMEIVLRAQFRVCPERSFSDTVYVFDLPKVDLGGIEKPLCIGGLPVVIKNLNEANVNSQRYLWNTGDTTSILKVVHPGSYSLTVREGPLGCSTTETIEVRKGCYTDIPNAFTPNGDGYNDYFFPPQLLSGNAIKFNIQISNRWGQVVFKTSSPDGRGWDGRFNKIPQPEGVYLYRVEAFFEGRRAEYYNGNVTLLR